MISAARTMNRRYTIGIVLLLAIFALMAGCSSTSDDVDGLEEGPGTDTNPLDGPDNTTPVDPDLQTPDVDPPPAADDQ